MGIGSGGVGGLGTANYFTAQEEKRLAALLDRQRRLQTRRARRRATAQEAVERRIDDARADLGRMLLLAATVRSLLVKKGLLSPSEIAAVARQLDLADGVADGKLDLRLTRPEASMLPRAAESPEDYLRRLEEPGP